MSEFLFLLKTLPNCKSSQLTGVVFILLLHCSACDKNLSQFRKKPNIYDSNSQIAVSFLQKEWSNGNLEAGGELNFAQVLGVGIEQNLPEAILNTHSLASAGVSMAHTTMGLLLNHNLTEFDLSEQDRKRKAMTNYITAAVKGDPIAQIIAGEDYYSKGDCLSAVSHYHKVASYAIQQITETEIYVPYLIKYVWEEDGSIPWDAFPSQDQLDFFEHLAANGESDAAMKAATLLLSGVPNIEKDMDKAHALLKQAVKGNDTMAMVFLAQMYLRHMMEGDDTEALDMLETALKYGNQLAHSGIARIYMEGRAGIPKNLNKAEFHFKQGIEAGNIDSFYQLGRLYYMDEGPGSYFDAIELWKVSAMVGHIHSAWCLAQHFYSELSKSYSTLPGSRSTEVGTKVCESAITYYRIVAQSGEWSYLFNEAFNDYSAGRKNTALVKYFLLSDLGYTAAHVNAARILDERSTEIYEDERSSMQQASEMWTRAIKDGVAKGHVKMGDYYYYGIGGNKQNFSTAAEHYRKANAMGDPEGAFSYALVTEWGEGVNQNIDKAVEIFNNLKHKNEDAEVPVAMALLRLNFFLFLRKNFQIDLYTWDWNPSRWIKTLRSVGLKYFYHWDVWLISILSVVIIINIKQRFR